MLHLPFSKVPVRIVCIHIYLYLYILEHRIINLLYFAQIVIVRFLYLFADHTWKSVMQCTCSFFLSSSL